MMDVIGNACPLRKALLGLALEMCSFCPFSLLLYCVKLILKEKKKSGVEWSGNMSG